MKLVDTPALGAGGATLRGSSPLRGTKPDFQFSNFGKSVVLHHRNNFIEKQLTKNGDGVTCPIAVIVKDGKVLTGHRHYTKDKWKEISVWTIPGGRSDISETIEQALRREVAEEVDIRDLDILDFIGEVPGAKDGDVVLMFYCTTKQEAKLMEPEKFSEWRWVPIKDYIVEESYGGFNLPARKMIIDYLAKL